MDDIDLNGAVAHLEKCRRAGKSLNTLNHAIRALKAFVHWAIREERMRDNPLVSLSLFNADTDRRRERRALDAEELRRLVAAAAGSEGLVNGMTGRERALLYRMAVETGFRWSELWRLGRTAFNFSDPPSVTLEAKDAKNRKRATLPLRPDLAAELKAYVGGHDGGRAFPTMWQDKGADMIRADLKATADPANGLAAIPYIDEAGRVMDFHALRHTFGTMLARAGVTLTLAQTLMRHSDPKLTANIYTHTSLEDKAAALAKLPATASASASATRAVGEIATGAAPAAGGAVQEGAAGFEEDGNGGDPDGPGLGKNGAKGGGKGVPPTALRGGKGKGAENLERKSYRRGGDFGTNSDKTRITLTENTNSITLSSESQKSHEKAPKTVVSGALGLGTAPAD